MDANPNTASLSLYRTCQETCLVPEENTGIVLQTLRQICEIRKEAENKNLFKAFLRARGVDAQAVLFDYLNGLPTHDLERALAQMERRIHKAA